MYKWSMRPWHEILQTEKLPANIALNFHCQNGGVRRVYDACGKQITFSKTARKYAWGWICENRIESFIVDTSRLDGYDLNKDVVIKISFLNGEPSGHPAFGNRRERTAKLKSIWGNTPYWGGV